MSDSTVTTKMLLPLENLAWFINTSYLVSFVLLAGRLSKSGLLCKGAHCGVSVDTGDSGHGGNCQTGRCCASSMYFNVGINSYLIDAIIGLSIVYKALDNIGAYQR